jgi:SAM-dependent methyltransferase
MSIKLNLGSGIQHWAGYINVDKFVTRDMIQEMIDSGNKQAIIQEGSEYLQADLMNMPLENDSVDYIESIDVIEHFGFRELFYLIKEIKRVMKPGAKFKFQTIDFNGLADEWVKKIINQPQPDISDYVDIMMGIYGNQLGEGQFHKCAWTPAFAYHIFITEHEFSDIQVSIFPKFCSKLPDFETALREDGLVFKNQVLVVEVTK